MVLASTEVVAHPHSAGTDSPDPSTVELVDLTAYLTAAGSVPAGRSLIPVSVIADMATALGAMAGADGAIRGGDGDGAGEGTGATEMDIIPNPTTNLMGTRRATTRSRATTIKPPRRPRMKSTGYKMKSLVSAGNRTPHLTLSRARQ